MRWLYDRGELGTETYRCKSTGAYVVLDEELGTVTVQGMMDGKAWSASYDLSEVVR